MNSDPDCIFCKIVKGDIPSEKLLEDSASLAFMDIGPVAPGHALLIPRNHFSTVDEMDPETAGQVLANLPRLVSAIKGATECEGVNVLQNNGSVAGQLVGHVHFHIIPRNTRDRFEFNWPADKYQEGQIGLLAGKIRGLL